MDTPVISDVIVRPSSEIDVPAMVAIYAHHVRNGLGTFDPEPLHDEDIRRRRKNMMKRRLPHLVAERSGMIVGYAYALAQLALHQERVRPAPELVADALQQPGLVKAERFVQLLRRLVLGIDVVDHLAEALGRAGLYEGGQQQPSDAGAKVIGMDVDGMLDGVAIGRPFAKRHGISIPHDHA